MCGLIGFIAPKKPVVVVRKNLLNFISQGIYVGGVRGRDSTGLMVVDRENYEVEVIKQAVDGSVFLDQYNVDKTLFDIEDYSCAVVHHRKATAGAVVTRNAHPFQYGHITLVHNGTIINHRALDGCATMAVDSAAITKAISEGNTIEVLEKLDGAFTLIWFDSSTNTFSIAKNNERPLSLGYTKTGDVIFASELGMLKWLAERNSIELTSTFSPAPFMLYSWKVDDPAKFTANNFDTTKFEEYDDPYKYAYGNYGNGSNRSNFAQGGDISTAAKAVPFTNNGTKGSREKELEKFSIKVGDTIEFVGYEYSAYSVNTAQGIVKGVDTAMQFEIISYGVGIKQDNKEWRNTLCAGTVLTVKDDPAFPYWITIVVTNPKILSEDYYEKKSFEEIVNTIFSEKNATHTSTTTSTHTENTTDVVEMAIGAHGKYITRKEWDKITSGGCSSCSCNLYSPSEVVWTYEGSPLCNWCSDNGLDDDYAIAMAGV